MTAGIFLLIALATGTQAADGLPAAPVTALAFAPDGASVVVATPHEVAELSWPEVKLRRKLSADVAHIHDLAFAPDGKRLAIAGGKPGEAGRVIIFSWPEGMPQRSLDIGGDVIYRAAWYPDGQKVALACGDKLVHVASLDGEITAKLEEHSAAVLAALVVPMRNKPLLMSAGRDQTIRVCSATNPDKSLRSLDNHTAAVHDLALRPAGDEASPLIASAGADRTVRFWQPAIGRLVRFARLPSPPLAICWTADGMNVAAACQDGRVRMVELATARVTGDHEAVQGWAYSIALVPDGKSLLVGGEAGQLKVVPSP